MRPTIAGRAVRADGLICDFVHISAREPFGAALVHARFDIIESDCAFPFCDEMTALMAARKLQPETRFRFVSGTIGEERAVEDLKLGATDFGLEAQLDQLGPAARRALREARERGKRKREAAANGLVITPDAPDE